jgi:hypothetical protein
MKSDTSPPLFCLLSSEGIEVDMNEYDYENDEAINVYQYSGRLMAYLKNEKRVISYPRYVMAKVLGRKLLPNEQVHHKDENPLNNNIDNLEVLTFEEHLKIHAEEQRKYYDKTMICPWCNKPFLWTAEQQSTFNVNIKRRKGEDTLDVPFCSKNCAGKYGRMVQQIKGYNNPGKYKRKLTEEQVKYIRENYIPKDKEFSGRALARKFNVDRSVIEGVLSGKTYKDVS